MCDEKRRDKAVVHRRSTQPRLNSEQQPQEGTGILIFERRPHACVRQAMGSAADSSHYSLTSANKILFSRALPSRIIAYAGSITYSIK